MKTITEKQRLVLDFIREYIHQNGMAPTHAEIAEALGWSSPNNSQLYLQALQRKGWLRIRRAVSRGIVLTENAAIDKCSNPAASLAELVPDAPTGHECPEHILDPFSWACGAEWFRAAILRNIEDKVK